MEIRLSGDNKEVDAGKEIIKENFDVDNISNDHKNDKEGQKRVYVHCNLKNK